MQLKPGTPAMTVLLAFMTAIGPLSTDIYLASMPHIATEFGASTGAVQLTLSLYLIGFAGGQIFYGPLSDSYGRRPLLLAGFALYLVATALCAFAPSIELLICARMVQLAQPGDRIVVLYGSGHAFLLRQCAAQTPGFRLVEAGRYLP